jgi:hypothetical protein
VAQDLLRAIRSVSSSLADACIHLGTAMRGSFLQLQAALAEDDVPRIAVLVRRVQDSDLITGIAGKFHHLREQATDLWNKLAPWGKTIFGLVVGLIGYFLAAELGVILSAILMVGGFLYAISSGIDAATRPAQTLMAD